MYIGKNIHKKTIKRRLITKKFIVTDVLLTVCLVKNFENNFEKNYTNHVTTIKLHFLNC